MFKRKTLHGGMQDIEMAEGDDASLRLDAQVQVEFIEPLISTCIEIPNTLCSFLVRFALVLLCVLSPYAR